MERKILTRVVTLAVVAAFLFGAVVSVTAKGMQEVSTYSLQVLHSSDNESSFQDPNTLEPKILHYGTVIEGLREVAPNEGRNTIYVTAGDHTLPKPFYNAAAEVDELGAPGLGISPCSTP